MPQFDEAIEMLKEKLKEYELNRHLRKCTLEGKYCGKKDQKGFCTLEYRCKYKLIEKIVLKKAQNQNSTVETLLEIEKKWNKVLSVQELLAITPKEEIVNENGLFIVDSKGYVFNIREHKLIAKR